MPKRGVSWSVGLVVVVVVIASWWADRGPASDAPNRPGGDGPAVDRAARVVAADPQPRAGAGQSVRASAAPTTRHAWAARIDAYVALAGSNHRVRERVARELAAMWREPLALQAGRDALVRASDDGSRALIAESLMTYAAARPSLLGDSARYGLAGDLIDVYFATDDTQLRATIEARIGDIAGAAVARGLAGRPLAPADSPSATDGPPLSGELLQLAHSGEIDEATYRQIVDVLGRFYPTALPALVDRARPGQDVGSARRYLHEAHND